MTVQRSELGPYRAGENAEPWVHTFFDADGVPIELAGPASLSYRLWPDGVQVVRTAQVVSAPDGTVGYDWVADDLATAGWLGGELVVVASSGDRLVRSFSMKVLEPYGGPIPAV